MKKICLTVAYDGTNFHGYQRQQGLRTIQGSLESIIKRITNETIDLHGAGRTDAGVHALGQVCHFITNSIIPSEKYRYILNTYLPEDLVIQNSMKVEMSFDARKSALWKTYQYEIDTSFVPNIRTRRFMTHYRHSLDVDAMKKAGQQLVGTFDYTSFCSAKTVIENKVRTIYALHILEEPNRLVIEVTGSGFLYNMVRIIVGTLMKVGKGDISWSDITPIIRKKNRQLAGPTFPSKGLTLKEVGYTPWHMKTLDI